MSEAYTCDQCAKLIEGKPAEGLSRPCGPGHRSFCSHTCHVTWSKRGFGGDPGVGEGSVDFSMFAHDCSVCVAGTWSDTAPLKYTCCGCLIAAVADKLANKVEPMIFDSHAKICEHLMAHLREGQMVPDRVWRAISTNADLSPEGIEILMGKVAEVREETRVRMNLPVVGMLLGAKWADWMGQPLDGTHVVLHTTEGKLAYATKVAGGWRMDSGKAIAEAEVADKVIGWILRDELPLDRLSKDQLVALARTGEASL